MSYPRPFDVSVIVPFSDDEDVIGTAVSRIASHLREMGLSFELIAVDEDSGDNCHAVLALLRNNIRELRVVNAGGRGRGFEHGARRAQGRILWLIEPTAATRPLAPLGRAYRRVARGEHDLVVVKRRFAVCHRTRCLPIIDGLKGSGTTFERRLARRGLTRGLTVEQQVLGGAEQRIGRSRLAERRWTRLIEVLTPARAALGERRW